MSRVPHKKIIQSVCHVIKKSDSACHLSENAESTGLEGILKQKKIIRTKSNFFFYSGQIQKCHILQGDKGLLTQIQYSIKD